MLATYESLGSYRHLYTNLDQAAQLHRQLILPTQAHPFIILLVRAWWPRLHLQILPVQVLLTHQSRLLTPPTRVQAQPPTLRALVRVQRLILRGQTHQQCILHQAQAQAHQPQFHPPIRLQALAQSCLAQYRVHPITLLVVLV